MTGAEAIELLGEQGSAAKTISWEMLPWAEAVRYLRDKVAISDDEFYAMEAWARAQSFTIAGVTKLEVIQQALDALERAISGGGTLEEFESDMDKVFAAAGVGPANPWLLETVFRTNVQSAYGKGQWEGFQDSQAAGVGWGWRYATVGDDRVREEHAALDGHVFQGNDGAEFWPPWDFGCRCHAEVISQDEAEQEGYEPSGEVPDGVREALSDFASPALGQQWHPDLTKYAPSAVSDFLDESE